MDDDRLGLLISTAVAEDRLRVVYQPVVRLADGVPVGVEALLRMYDDHGGLVMPDTFIPVAERTGAIVGMGAFVLATACEQVAWWKQRLPRDADFAAGINVSPRQLQDPCLLDTIESARGDLDPSVVVLELTESLPPPSSPTELTVLRQLRHRGFHLSLDDFGTGHASARTLRSLPFDNVKLDRSWTARLGRSDAAGELARSLTSTALRSGCNVVVEGIETLAHRDVAGALGCKLGQGYLWSRPVPADELTRWLAVQGGLVDQDPAQPGSDVAPSPWDNRVSGRA